VFSFSQSILVNRPVADVWAVLIDFPNVPNWERGPVEVRQVSPGPPGVGTELVTVRPYLRRRTDLQCRITEWQDQVGATISLVGGPLEHASVRYSVEPAGEGRTRVTYSAEGEPRGPLKVLTPLMPMVGRREARLNLRNLKRLLEQSA
jgi:carbon monoxide dehydrogenase subunit G